MNPDETGARYSRIAAWWQNQMDGGEYGIAQLKRALSFAEKCGRALDVGCGSQGRFIQLLGEHGFDPEGIDVSSEMVALAKVRHPNFTFYEADISTWNPPKKYAFISAWDSTFHLPPDQQEPVLKKLCDALAPGGVFIFTCGGGGPGEISGSFAGENFEYSTLGVNAFLTLLQSFGLNICHFEYDQYPEPHVYMVATKPTNP